MAVPRFWYAAPKMSVLMAALSYEVCRLKRTTGELEKLTSATLQYNTHRIQHDTHGTENMAHAQHTVLR